MIRSRKRLQRPLLKRRKVKIRVILNILRFVESYKTVLTLSRIPEIKPLVNDNSLIVSLRASAETTPEQWLSIESSLERVTQNIVSYNLDQLCLKTNYDQRYNVPKQIIDIDESVINAFVTKPKFVILEIFIGHDSRYVNNPLDLLDNFDFSRLTNRFKHSNFIHIQIIPICMKQERFSLSNLPDFLDIYKFQLFSHFNFGQPKPVTFHTNAYHTFPEQNFNFTNAHLNLPSSKIKFGKLSSRVANLVENATFEVISFDKFKAASAAEFKGTYHFNCAELKLEGLDLCGEESVRYNMQQFNVTFKNFILAYFKYIIFTNMKMIMYNGPVSKGFDLTALGNFNNFKTFLISTYCRSMFMKPENEYLALDHFFESCIENKFTVKNLKFDYFNLVNCLNYYANDNGFVKTVTDFDSRASFTDIIKNSGIIEQIADPLFDYFRINRDQMFKLRNHVEITTN